MSAEDDEVRVLVVDDVQDTAEALACMLQADGYSTLVATAGEQALAMIAEHPPHCVLVDIDMPGIDGFELARRLRERYAEEIVLIAVTGWGSDEERVSSAYAAFDHCMRKPVEQAALQRVLPPVN